MNDQKGTTKNSFKVGDKVRVLPHKNSWVDAGATGVVESVAPLYEGMAFPVRVAFEDAEGSFRANELELIVPEPVNHDPKIALLESILATLERIEAGGRHLVGPATGNPVRPQNLEPKTGEGVIWR